MNVAVRQPVAAQRLKVVDCDIHPAYATPSALYQFLPQRWRDHWVDLRHLLPPWRLAGAAAVPAHDGRAACVSSRSPRTAARPGPTST